MCWARWVGLSGMVVVVLCGLVVDVALATVRMPAWHSGGVSHALEGVFESAGAVPSAACIV